MAKLELTQEEKDFRLDSLTLNNQFAYWLERSMCVQWNLKETNERYNSLRIVYCHSDALEALKRKMFEIGLTTKK